MNNIIKALNLNEGEVLTLEKMEDRMEFEAMAVMAGLYNMQKTASPDPCGIHDVCTVCLDSSGCSPRYISQEHCHPYTDCHSNNCRPVDGN